MVSVHGQKLIADTGKPLRGDFLAEAIDPARWSRAASALFTDVRGDAPDYVAARTRALEHAAATT